MNIKGTKKTGHLQCCFPGHYDAIFLKYNLNQSVIALCNLDMKENLHIWLSYAEALCSSALIVIQNLHSTM